ncbi:MAG: nitrilase family protein [Bacteroidetes bacterium]|nr:nitrilase family protein [Bacteroidota bacterium]
MQDLNIILVQTSIHWEKPHDNRIMFDQKLRTIDSFPDLIVFPEMFNTGFTMKASRFCEPAEGPTFHWIQEKAAEYKCVIAGSILTEDGGHYFNRMYWVRPDGRFDFYDKRHLFRMGNEHKTMTQGNHQKIVEFKGWKICLQICYDLRFPVWSRNRYKDGIYAYDLLIYVANWPAMRRNAYLSLLKARAIENQSCVLWVNRVGKDGHGVDHSGDTMGIDAYGNTVAVARPDHEQLLTLTLAGSELLNFRDKFRVGLDWDDFRVL